MFNRIQAIVLITISLLALAACGSNTSQTPAAAPTVPAAATAAAAEPTAAVAPTAAPAAAPTAASSQPAAPAASANMRTFQIVPELTEASYEVQEQFFNRPLPNKAIGKTNAVTGEFQFSTDGQPTGQVTKITVDLRTLTSDSSRRDGRIRTQWLESDTYPFAEFTSTEAQGLPASYTEGQEVSFKLVGDMTIREVTRPVTFDVVGKLEGDTVTGTATTQILMRDFGFDPPSIAGMLTVEDGVTIKVDFTAQEAG